MNKYMTREEWHLIKGKVNSVFSRSKLRKETLDKQAVGHSDPDRPRVKNWCWCAICGELDAKSYFEVDHILPKVGINETFDDIKSLDEYIDRVWCNPSNLQAICIACHNRKSSLEKKQRSAYRKLSGKNKMSRRNSR